MNHSQKINQKNLKRLCWKRGISVSDLCKIVGRHPTTVYRAVKRPHQFRPTYAQILQALGNED